MLLTELDCTGIGALTTVGVTYLTELGLSGTETGIVFLVVLLSTIPGSAFATYLSRKLKSPTLSIKMCSIFFIISNFVAFFMISYPVNEDSQFGFSPRLWVPPQHARISAAFSPIRRAAMELAYNFPFTFDSTHHLTDSTPSFPSRYFPLGSILNRR